MKFDANFINNCNIMVALLFFVFIVSGIAYLVSFFIELPRVEAYSLLFLKQGLITLIMFNSFNVAFAAGVHLKYAFPSDPLYGFSTFLLFASLLLIVLAAVAMEFASTLSYGEFKNKFKKAWESRTFIPITILYRLFLGLFCGANFESETCMVFAVGASLLFMLYFLVHLPFTDPYHNYRSFFCHATMFATLVVACYYRSMKSTTPIQVKGRIYAPAIIEIVLIGICIAVSAAVIVYEIYQTVVRWRAQKQREEGTVPVLPPFPGDSKFTEGSMQFF